MQVTAVRGDFPFLRNPCFIPGRSSPSPRYYSYPPVLR